MDVTINTSYIPVNYDKVVPEWPDLKQQRIEETQKRTVEKSQELKSDTAYAYHPHNQNKFTTQGQIVDFVIA
jgi:hypothetical protein